LFEEFKEAVDDQTRQIWIEKGLLNNKVVSLENFTDKYVPLIAQNIT
jgi:hypothetical protein